jgi:hypothetical protein
MKRIIKVSITSIYLMLCTTMLGQVGVTISNMNYISGTPISNCGNIDFDINSTVRIQFTTSLTKQSTQTVGIGNLYIYTVGSSGVRVERSNVIVQPVSFNTNYSSSFDITIPAVDFNTTGGTLFAVFKTNSGNEYQTTCNYTITKTQQPVFNLSPISTTLDCGSAAAKTFTVTNQYNSPGILSYQWTYPGWSGTVNTSMSSVTLTPTSSTTLPGNVTVTPYLNGVAQPTKTSTVVRSAFASSATISGSSAVCSSSTYTMSGLLAGQSVTSWTVSNPSKATLSTTSGTSTTVTKTGSGSITLTATITNSCNQTVTKSIDLQLGIVNVPGAISGPASVATGALVNYSIANVPGATSYIWYLPYPYDTYTNFDYSGQNWQKRTNYSSSSSIQVFTGLGGNQGQVQVMAVNACGISGASRLSVTHGGGGGGIPRTANPDAGIKIYPNPATDYFTVELINQEIDTNSDIRAIIYDTNGTELKNVKIISSTTTFETFDFKAGMYIVEINIDGYKESYKIYVE